MHRRGLKVVCDMLTAFHNSVHTKKCKIACCAWETKKVFSFYSFINSVNKEKLFMKAASEEGNPAGCMLVCIYQVPD